MALAKTLPILFVVLWSSGFIGAKFGLPYAEPGTFLAYRFTLVTVLLFLAARLLKSSWPHSWTQWAHIAVAGLLLQAVNLGCVFYALYFGVGAGVVALIAGIQPLLVAIASGFWLGERISGRQWLGFILGVTGVALVVWHKLDGSTATHTGMVLAFLALIGLTTGVLYQKRYCERMDLITGTLLQTAISAVAMWCIAVTLETGVIQWTLEFLFAFLWLSLFLSLGAIMLLVYLIRQGQAARVSSLFFLIPPCTALMAYLFFSEAIGLVTAIGMVVAVSGVALVRHGPEAGVK